MKWLRTQLYHSAGNLYRWAVFNRDWAERAEAELRRWRNTEPSPAKRRRALARIEAAVEGHDSV